MTGRSLIPWRRKDSALEVRRERDPFLSQYDMMDRMLDSFFDMPFGSRSLQRFDEDLFFPKVDVYETEKEIVISAELPGIEEKDIDISLSGSALTISGKKESEEVEKGKSFYRRERSFGSFRRSIELPSDVKEDQIEAVYEKGILKVTVPKPDEIITRRIKIKKG